MINNVTDARKSNLTKKAQTYLEKLCIEIPTRRVGSAGNRAATAFFADKVTSFGFETRCPAFDCVDWTQDGAELTIDNTSFEVFASPYSLGCQVTAPFIVISTIEELETADFSDKVVLLRGEIAKEQLMPKNFPFYNPDHHKRIIKLLETKKPRAIIAATTQDPGLAGAVSPFPLIEDCDFDIPSVYMTDEEGNRLLEHAGAEVSLISQAERIPATGCNVVARKGAVSNRRVVLFAHIDAKMGTPGAIDNATGVVILLLLAELLADYSGDLGIEIVALNGEDYCFAPGEQLYVSENAGKFDEIVLGINMDGVGYHQGHTAYSLYDCPAHIDVAIREVFSNYAELVEGEPWYQSDHGLFLMHQRPALALTTSHFIELWTEITHTPKDRPEIVNVTKLVDVAVALRKVVLSI